MKFTILSMRWNKIDHVFLFYVFHRLDFDCQQQPLMQNSLLALDLLQCGCWLVREEEIGIGNCSTRGLLGAIGCHQLYWMVDGSIAPRMTAEDPDAHCKANNLCYKCGDKFVQGHKRAIPPVQANAIQVGEEQEVLSNEVLDVIVANGIKEEEEMHLSVNAISGTPSVKTIQVRALVKNQVMFMLLDFGSSHSFVSQEFATRIGCHQTPMKPRMVKVSNGDMVNCPNEIKSFTWWVPNCTFQHDMKVL